MRYYSVEMRSSLLESVIGFFRTWKWERTWTLYVGVRPEDEGYDMAPYEATIQYMPGVWKVEIRQ